MLNWLNFALLCYWGLFFSLLLGAENFFSLLLGAEALWVALYFLAALLGSIVDDLGVSSLTFFILGFAAAELASGLMLMVLMKYTGLSLSLGQASGAQAPKNG